MIWPLSVYSQKNKNLTLNVQKHKNLALASTHIKKKLKGIINLNVKFKTIKFLGGYICDLDLGKDFLNRIYKH